MTSTGTLNYTPHELKPGSFVYEITHALPRSVCDDMIHRFEANPEQQTPGRLGQQQEQHASIKRSTDLPISGHENWKDVDHGLHLSLSTALKELVKLHPFFASNSFCDMGYNLQRTAAGEYYHWHTDSGPGEFSQRQLVAIWYLNEPDGSGGETEFHFQDIKVRPEAGKLILFPPFWTHIHRGITLECGVKYLATTWLCFKGTS